MSEVYVAAVGGGEPVPTDEEVLRTLWDQGLLSEDLLYWKREMPDWVPVSDVFGPGTNRDPSRAAVSPNGAGPVPGYGHNGVYPGFAAGHGVPVQTWAIPLRHEPFGPPGSGWGGGYAPGGGASAVFRYLGVFYFALAVLLGFGTTAVAVYGFLEGSPWLLGGSLAGGFLGGMICATTGMCLRMLGRWPVSGRPLPRSHGGGASAANETDPPKGNADRSGRRLSPSK